MFLSPLLFIIVLIALSGNFCGLPMELLYASDLFLVADTAQLLVEVSKWKDSMEEKRKDL